MKHTKKMVAHFERDYTGTERFVLFACDMSNHGYTPVCEVDVEFETPDDFNPIAAEIATLRGTKQKILADAQVQANEIDRLIAEKSCIEFKPEASHV